MPCQTTKNRMMKNAGAPRTIAAPKINPAIADFERSLRDSAHAKVRHRRGTRRAEPPARRYRRPRAAVRGGHHGLAPQREEPQRISRFDRPRRGRGHGRVSRSRPRRSVDSPPPRSNWTLAPGSGRYPLDAWRRLRGDGGCRRGGGESTNGCCCICSISVPTSDRPPECWPMRSSARAGGTKG